MGPMVSFLLTLGPISDHHTDPKKQHKYIKNVTLHALEYKSKPQIFYFITKSFKVDDHQFSDQ